MFESKFTGITVFQISLSCYLRALFPTDLPGQTFVLIWRPMRDIGTHDIINGDITPQLVFMDNYTGNHIENKKWDENFMARKCKFKQEILNVFTEI